MIALDILQHNPLSNPSNMNPREKKKVIKMMETWFEKEDSEINEEFNDIVNNKILHYVFDFLILFSGNRQIPGLETGAVGTACFTPVVSGFSPPSPERSSGGPRCSPHSPLP